MNRASGFGNAAAKGHEGASRRIIQRFLRVPLYHKIVVGNSIHSDLLHTRKLRHHPLYLSRVHVEASAQDHVCLPTNHMEIPLSVTEP